MGENAGRGSTLLVELELIDIPLAGIDIESEKFGNIPHWRPYRLVRDTNEANDRAYAFIVSSCSFDSSKPEARGLAFDLRLVPCTSF